MVARGARARHRRHATGSRPHAACGRRWGCARTRPCAPPGRPGRAGQAKDGAAGARPVGASRAMPGGDPPPPAACAGRRPAAAARRAGHPGCGRDSCPGPPSGRGAVAPAALGFGRHDPACGHIGGTGARLRGCRCGRPGPGRDGRTGAAGGSRPDPLSGAGDPRACDRSPCSMRHRPARMRRARAGAGPPLRPASTGRSAGARGASRRTAPAAPHRGRSEVVRGEGPGAAMAAAGGCSAWPGKRLPGPPFARRGACPRARAPVRSTAGPARGPGRPPGPAAPVGQSSRRR